MSKQPAASEWGRSSRRKTIQARESLQSVPKEHVQIHCSRHLLAAFQRLRHPIEEISVPPATNIPDPVVCSRGSWLEGVSFSKTFSSNGPWVRKDPRTLPEEAGIKEKDGVDQPC